MNALRTFALLLAAISFSLAGCRSATHPLSAAAVAPSAATPSVVAEAKEFHVDQGCHLLSDRIDGVAGVSDPGLQKDNAVCHLESVHTSQHVEESLSNNTASRTLVVISEQEYLLQNVTAQPVSFLVEQPVPAGWRVDSDPQPVKMMGTIAIFRVTAEPGQIVRLHVGERHATPIADPSRAS